MSRHSPSPFKMGRHTPQGKEKIRVYYLENADAESLSKVLQEVPSRGAAADKTKGTAPVVSENVRITADKATNSLVITANPDDYLVIEEIVKRLDIPRPMVYIEALFMEVDAEKDLELGTEWAAAGKTSISGKDAAVIVEEKGLKQITDTGAIEAAIAKVIADNPGQVEQYTSGANPKVIGWFVGQVMKATQGKANPGMVNQLLKKHLDG